MRPYLFLTFLVIHIVSLYFLKKSNVIVTLNIARRGPGPKVILLPSISWPQS